MKGKVWIGWYTLMEISLWPFHPYSVNRASQTWRTAPLNYYKARQVWKRLTSTQCCRCNRPQSLYAYLDTKTIQKTHPECDPGSVLHKENPSPLCSLAADMLSTHHVTHAPLFCFFGGFWVWKGGPGVAKNCHCMEPISASSRGLCSAFISPTQVLVSSSRLPVFK